MTQCAAARSGDLACYLEHESANLRSIFDAVYALPGSFSLEGIDIFGRCFPLNGRLGGDHLVFIDFARHYDLDRRVAVAVEAGHTEIATNLERIRSRVGVLIADVSGHDMTDTLLVGMLHQAFLVGVSYELLFGGTVTPRLFETLNSRFYQSSSVTKFITMTYGEIDADGTFRFISAGHPKPLVFSAELGCFVQIDPTLMTSVHPIGLFPTENDVDLDVTAPPPAVSPSHTVNEVSLMGRGDVLLLFTDGAFEHLPGDLARQVEATMRSTAKQSSREIVDALRAELIRTGPAKDDMSLVAIKRL